MAHQDDQMPMNHGGAARTERAVPERSIVIVCEHATYHIPAALNDLGVSPPDRQSHAAWDPGALAVAERMARHLGAELVAAEVSRLVYDCNRPPGASDAMPTRSEVIEVPGNRNLTPSEREARVATYYRPFHDRLARVIAGQPDPVMVTVHSFTPVYHGRRRAVEIGILHDSDARLADAMLDLATGYTPARVERNKPYGPQDGVTHTLKEHAIKDGLPNVMVEIRNDLIASSEQQDAVAAMLSRWVAAAVARLPVAGLVAGGIR